MISNASGHSRTSMVPFYHNITVEALTKAAMRADQIKVCLIQMHLSLKPHNSLTEGTRLSGKAAVFMSQIQVVPFDVHRMNIFERDITKHCPFGDTDDMSLIIPLLNHLAITQRRAVPTLTVYSQKSNNFNYL